MDPEKVEKIYGRGKYSSWHGDGKSQSKTNITFQTKSMYTSGQPPKYITIVARKGRTGAYVTYESPTWSETTKTIIDEMIKAIEVKSKDGGATTGPLTMPMEPSQQSGQELTQMTICPRLQSGHPRSDFGVNLGEPTGLISKVVEHPGMVEPHAGGLRSNFGINLDEPSRLISKVVEHPSLVELHAIGLRSNFGTNLDEPSGLKVVEQELHAGGLRSNFGVNLDKPPGLISKEVEHPDVVGLHAGG